MYHRIMDNETDLLLSYPCLDIGEEHDRPVVGADFPFSE